MATKRPRITVNLLPSDAEWLRRNADDHAVSLSEALQVLIGRARSEESLEEDRQRRRVARELRSRQAEMMMLRQLDFHCLFEGTVH